MPETKKGTNIIHRVYFGDEESGAVRLATLDKDAHRLEFVITTETPVVDSYYGPPRSLSMKGVNLKRYRKNPIILAQHTHGPIEVVGRTLKVFTEDNKLIARAEFDIDDEFSARVWGKIERGFLRAASVGYRVTRERIIEDGKEDKATGLVGPVAIATAWTLIEWSVVAVGADSESLGRDIEPESVEEEDDAAVESKSGKKFFIPRKKVIL